MDLKNHVGDGTAIAVSIAAVFRWLPEATALLSFVWIAIRVAETRTARTFWAWAKSRLFRG
jgi:hypothetical protein